MSEIQREWLRRVEAEYASAALTHHLALWLLQLTAPLELVRMALSIVEDELTHAELSQAVYAAAGGTGQARLERNRLGLRQPPKMPLELALARANLELFCLGETVAVRLFSRLRRGCVEPVALAALDRILRDEVKHRDFGWALLEWQLDTEHAEPVRALAQRELPHMFARLRSSYGFEQLDTASTEDPVARRWGLMPIAEYVSALRDTLERDYVPRFADRGLDAGSAWEAERQSLGHRQDADG
jgi:hypothetical protein